jgi:hypothetical protein
MPGFVRTSWLWAAAAVAALVAVPSAIALPPPDAAAGPASPGAATPAALPLPALVPPANDAFGAAQAVGSLPFSAAADTLEATTAPDDPLCVGNSNSVWYAYTSPVTVWLAASTAGSNYDTTLAAYTGTQGALVQVACNDDTDAGSPQAEIAFLAQAGETYYLLAAALEDGGALHLALDIRPPLAQIGVRTTRAYEGTPAASADAFAWAQWPWRNGRSWTAFVQRAGEPRFRVNFTGSNGFPGGFDGDLLAFQETRGDRSTIVLYDIATHTRSAPPAGVNTRAWEWHPSISGDWMLFSRRNVRARTDTVILRNMATGETRVLDRLTRTSGSRFSETGQVSGNHAVWYRCATLCRVYHHDIQTGVTTVVPNPAGRHQYEPSVTDDGTLYYVSSGNGCGVSVRFVRRTPAGATTALASLPRRWDSFRTYALESSNGTTTFFYERVHCRTSAWDVLKVVDP